MGKFNVGLERKGVLAVIFAWILLISLIIVPIEIVFAIGFIILSILFTLGVYCIATED